MWGVRGDVYIGDLMVIKLSGTSLLIDGAADLLNVRWMKGRTEGGAEESVCAKN